MNEEKKWICLFRIILIGCIGCIVCVLIRQKMLEHDRERAQEIFLRKEVEEFEKDLQGMGFSDIVLKSSFYDSDVTDEWISFSFALYSREIDALYEKEPTTEDTYWALIRRLASIRNEIEKFDHYYSYKVGISEVCISVTCSYGTTRVIGREHTYELHKGSDGSSLYIDDEFVFTTCLPKSEGVLNNTNKYKGNYSNSESSRKDVYGVYDYDDPDDFADEWAEEFGDGDYDAGYDDAFEYWEEHY